MGRAVEYWSKATELRDAKANYKLSIHHAGREFEGKEILYHLEEAAIGGHPEALGIVLDYSKTSMAELRELKTLDHCRNSGTG